jgi:outer membrane receptor for ferrienterochelin and colicins
MRRIILSMVALLFVAIVNGQYTFRAIIKHGKDSLANATVIIKDLKKSAAADDKGLIIFSDLPAGVYTFIFSHVGYKQIERKFTIPSPTSEILEIELEESEEEEEEVIIQSTRTSRTIQNIPTRVETIAGEEVDEKNNMRPANVSMLLHESTGIHVQQTSATSANASIRIQGLDGRYTQILKDGFPNFSGFSGGLSVLEIPPLDLKQVEIIKGPASTLYGGGAIAGVINFISIEPGANNYAKLLLNQSNIGQTNVAAFVTQKNDKMGFTMLLTGNRQQAYDVDKDEFTEVPKTRDFTFSPKIFFYPRQNTQLSIGHTITTGDRRGGDILVLQGKADPSHTYFENNKTFRNITNIEFRKKIKENNRIVAKQSLSFFDRKIQIPGYGFKGLQSNAYADISYLQKLKNHIFISGVNFIYDDFKENKSYSGVERNERNITGGIYIQDSWDASGKLSFENGLRIDVTNRYGVFVLPKISVLYRINRSLSSRIGAGMGYKLATMFTEQTETIQYKDVAALDQNLEAEKSYGATADINFRNKISDGLELSFNHMFFYTVINHPLILQAGIVPGYFFVNADKTTQSYGFETNAKFILKDTWKLFVGYTLNETKAKWQTGNQFLPLVPRGKLNLALIYEKHDFLKIGLEGYRTEKQFLSNGNSTPAFWEFGFMAEKPLGKISLYINFENFTDERQSNYKAVVNAPHSNPSFDEIWNHTEGFAVNGGIKIKL